MPDFKQTPLEVILKEKPDYDFYLNLEFWSLFDAVCLLIEKWPDKNAQKYWPESDKENFNEVQKQILSGILDEKISIKTTSKEHHVGKNAIILWGDENLSSLPEQLKTYSLKNNIPQKTITFSETIKRPQRSDDWCNCIIDHAINFNKTKLSPPSEPQLWSYLNNSDMKGWQVDIEKHNTLKLSSKKLDREAFSKRFKKYFN